MHRNTYLLVTFLAIVAALLIGINLGRGLSTKPSTTAPPKATHTPLPIPTISANIYTNVECGITLEYPGTLTKLESTGSALFVDGTTNTQAFAVACQKEIPRPPLPADKIETKIVTNEARTASVSARLYHDASAKDGEPVDALIFHNAKTNMDVYIAGFGSEYNKILTTLRLLP